MRIPKRPENQCIVRASLEAMVVACVDWRLAITKGMVAERQARMGIGWYTIRLSL
jgi:hypothetical protein